jgi:hypothetical protein
MISQNRPFNGRSSRSNSKPPASSSKKIAKQHPRSKQQDLIPDFLESDEETTSSTDKAIENTFPASSVQSTEVSHSSSNTPVILHIFEVYLDNIYSNSELKAILEKRNDFAIIYSRLQEEYYNSLECWVSDVLETIERIIHIVANPIFKVEIKAKLRKTFFGMTSDITRDTVDTGIQVEERVPSQDSELDVIWTGSGMGSEVMESIDDGEIENDNWEVDDWEF